MRRETGCWAFAAALISLASLPAHAGESCDSQIVESVGEHFKIDNFKPSVENGVISAATCKTWPYKDNIVIAAFAYAKPQAQKDAESEKGLLVVTMDKSSRGVISSYRGTLAEDAMTEVGPDSFQLDTARYQLSKDVRGFGLRFHSDASGPSCAESEFYNQLTLFVPNGNELRPVFKQFMNFQRALSGCIGAESGHDSWENASLSISIEKTARNGYADLKISAVIEPGTDIKPVPATMNMMKRVETYLLHFDGNAYSPDGNTPWWWALE